MPNAEVIDLSEGYRQEYRARMLGRYALIGENRPQNNDPLAPVILLLEHGDDIDGAISRILSEYESDMSERSKDKHFYRRWDYAKAGNDFVSDTGVSWAEMMSNGVDAAEQDYLKDPRLVDAYERAQIQAEHLPQILEWYEGDSTDCLRISSLCPPEDELPAEIAKLSNFRPERQMGSEWILEKTWFDGSPSGLRLYAFSLDSLTLERLAKANERLGLEPPAKTTLEQLKKIDCLPFASGQEAMAAVVDAHDQLLNAEKGGDHLFGIDQNQGIFNAFNAVQGKPRAENLYVKTARELATSLKASGTSEGLAAIIQELRSAFDELSVPPALQINYQSAITVNQARDLMEYLRSQALPHYIYGQDQQNEAPLTCQQSFAQNTSSFGGGHGSYGGIAHAGAQAVSSGLVYEGACPTSPSTTASRQAEATSAVGVNGRTANLAELKKQNKSEWFKHYGYCVVDNCERKNKLQKVGPCSVCRGCQEVFDHGPKVDVWAPIKNELAQLREQKRRRLAATALRRQQSAQAA